MSPDILRAILDILAGVIGTAIVGGIAFYINSRRGNRVIFAQVGKTSLVTTSEKVRQNLKILYKDKNVHKLFLYEFELYNDGVKDLKDVILNVHIGFIKEKGFIEIETVDNLDLLQTLTPIPTLMDNVNEAEIKLSRPFLNSIKRYKEEKIELKIYSDSELSFSIKGGGEGWYSKLKVGSDNSWFISILTILMGILLLGILFIFKILPSAYGYITAGFMVIIYVFNFITLSKVMNKRRYK